MVWWTVGGETLIKISRNSVVKCYFSCCWFIFISFLLCLSSPCFFLIDILLIVLAFVSIVGVKVFGENPLLVPIHTVTHASQLPADFLEPSIERQLVIGFDCEGIDLCRSGTLCIMQVVYLTLECFSVDESCFSIRMVYAYNLFIFSVSDQILHYNLQLVRSVLLVKWWKYHYFLREWCHFALS